MRYILAISLALASSASAQVSNPSQAPVLGIGGGAARLDSAGTLNGNVLGSLSSGANRFSLSTMSQCVSPTQSIYNSLACVATTATSGGTYMINLGLTTSATGDQVVGYFGAHALAGSGGVWAMNGLINLDRGSGGGIISELDLNNFMCDPGTADGGERGCEGSQHADGVLVTGVPVPYTAGSAIQITGDFQATTAMWHQGISFSGATIDYANIWENTTAHYVERIQGAHDYGLDFTNSTLGGAAILLNRTKANQAIVWTTAPYAADADSFSISVDTNGSNLRLHGAGGSLTVSSTGTVGFPSFVTGSLPATGAGGRQVFCSDCQKPGEAPGAGTGTMVFDDGHGHWISTAVSSGYQSTTYTSSGTLLNTDQRSILNGSSPLSMTLPNGIVDGQGIVIKNLGTATATITGKIDGLSLNSIALSPTAPIKGAVRLSWSVSASSWIVE